MKTELIEFLESKTINELIKMCNDMPTGIDGYDCKADLINHIVRTYDQYIMWSTDCFFPANIRQKAINRSNEMIEIIEKYRRLSFIIK